MTTLMKHQDHGWMHAYSDDEIKRLQALGWAVDAPVKAEPVEPLVLPVVDAMSDEPRQKRKYTRKAA